MNDPHIPAVPISKVVIYYTQQSTESALQNRKGMTLTGAWVLTPSSVTVQHIFFYKWEVILLEANV